MTSEHWTRENLAWIAGIVEGEGYIAGRPIRENDGKSVGLQIQIEMTDEDVIRRVATLSGVGGVSGPFRRESRKHVKDTWGYGVYGVEAYALLIAILPWLCERRSGVALASIKQWLSQPGRGVASRKLNDDQVREIRQAVNVDGRTIREVADTYNSNHHSIMQIARGIYYKTVPNFA